MRVKKRAKIKQARENESVALAMMTTAKTTTSINDVHATREWKVNKSVDVAAAPIDHKSNRTKGRTTHVRMQ